MKKVITRMLCVPALLFGGMGLLWAQDSTMGQATAPDNTKMNQRDRDSGQATADQQQNNQADRQLTAQIRRSITKDKSLSTDAHNVKIISQNGAVTLKGPVDSEEEKKTIETKAAEVAGADQGNQPN